MNVWKHMARGLLAAAIVLAVAGSLWAAKADLVPVRSALDAGDAVAAGHELR
jgi:hypothetical protein